MRALIKKNDSFAIRILSCACIIEIHFIGSYLLKLFIHLMNIALICYNISSVCNEQAVPTHI